MKNFSIFTAPVHAFSSRDLYRDVGQRWGFKTFALLLLVILVAWIPFMWNLNSGLSTFLNEEGAFVIEQVPPITLNGGSVSVDAEQPYYIRKEGSEEVIAIIDTTGEVTSLEGTTAVFLLTETAFHTLGESRSQTKVTELKGMPDFYVDAPRLEKWVPIIGTWGIILLYPILVFVTFIYRIIQALFYAAIGLLMVKNKNCSLGFGGILRVAVVAIIPVILITAAVDALGIRIPYIWVGYFAMAMAWLKMGLSANADDEVEDDDDFGDREEYGLA
ncbi:MAG: hypothetical protein ACI8QS_001940 [Planctomycetota bacterium]|jgi:hypothetical protein